MCQRQLLTHRQMSDAGEQAPPEEERSLPALVPSEASLRPPTSVGSGRGVHGGSARVLRRYFFAAPDARQVPLHFDVLLDPEDKIDGSTDHLRYRYVDFLTLPGAEGILDRRTNSADIEDVRSWLDEAKPATRIEAYPLFVVAKELLHHLLEGGVTFGNRAADSLRAELDAASKKMESLREAAAAAEAVLAAEISEASARIADLEAALKMLEKDAEEQIAALSAELTKERGRLSDAEKAKAELEAQLDEIAAQMLGVEEKIASALGDCYEPGALVDHLRSIIDGGALQAVLAVMDTDDKLALVRQIMQTFEMDQKHEALREVFASFVARELDLAVVPANIREPEKESILQQLLVEFKHDPATVLKQLGGAEEGAAQRLEETGVGLAKEAMAKGVPQKVLCDALALDKMALVKALLEEVGLESFLRSVGVDGKDVCASLGLVDPELEKQPEPVGHPVRDDATQTDDSAPAVDEPEGVKRRHASKVLSMFSQVPEDGDSAPEPMSFSPMTKLITKLYEDKVQADEVDDREVRKIVPDLKRFGLGCG